MYCINCGNKINDKNKFCTSCGKELNNNIPINNNNNFKTASIILGSLSIIASLTFIFVSYGFIQTRWRCEKFRITRVFR